MADHNLTGLKGFGEGDPKPDRHGEFKKKMADIDSRFKAAADKIGARPTGWKLSDNAKSKALSKKSGAGAEHLASLQKKHGYNKEGTERYKKFFGMK